MTENEEDGWDEEENEEDGWGNENEEDGNEEDGGWGDGDGESKLEPPVNIVRQNSTPELLTVSEIDKAMQTQIDILKEKLYLESDEKCLLLLRYKRWNIQRVLDIYFNDPDKVLGEAGFCLNPKSVPKTKGEIECGLCMDDVKVKNVYALICGHQKVCSDCWVDYLKNGVRSKECVNLVCPDYKCSVIVPKNTWQHFLEKNDNSHYLRYIRFCRENFVEFSKEFKFCPGKGCDQIYKFEAGITKEVICSDCKYRFCWACQLESHFPASCHLAKKWITKCSSEAENLQWILARTKICPKCKVHIEKNQGCNHMTCRKHVGGCGYEFCWLCKGDWKAHGSQTGGYYKCNVYEENKKKGIVNEEEKSSQDAQNELQRYEFHWTRFDSHNKSSKHSIEVKEKIGERMHNLSQKFGWNLNEAQFIADAIDEAIQCYHVLAWTYAIAYYADKNSNKELFTTHQGQLEKFCNGLQEKIDFDQEKLGDNKVRQEMIGYTRTSKQFRKNLVEYIESEISF